MSELKQNGQKNLEQQTALAQHQEAVVDPINESIETIASLHKHMEKKVGRHQRAVETVTAFLGRPRFLYFVLLFVGLWILFNLVLKRASFDPPPFYWLQGLVGLSALLMTFIILITENRQNKHTEQRRQLDLHLNLLIEQKTTKIIDLLEQIRRDSPDLENRYDPEVEALQASVDPHEVLATLNDMMKEVTEQPD